MGQFVQTNGDYTIKTAEEGTIKFDTGAGVGEVRVTGNLVVEGDTLTVSAENLNVNDNVIILNFGETGAGVSLRYSGIQIDRGTLQPGSLVFDDNDDTWNFSIGSPEGVFNYDESNIRVRRIKTNPDTDAGDLTLIGTGTGVVKVAGTTNYELQITDDDDIPNKKYVDDAIRDNPTFQIVDNNTRVIVTDVDVSGSAAYLLDETGFSTFGESGVSVIVEDTLSAQFYASRVVFKDIEIVNNEITTNNLTNENIYIRTQGTGKLQTNYGIQVEKISVTPAFVSDSVIMYAGDPTLGESGLYFTNAQGTGELISKRKSILYSMIF